ncbi:unnamed protein product [Gadus morhua 'NCC']
MLFAIDEINRSDSLLPNVTLGYRLHDNCVSLGVAFRAAFSLASGKEVMFDQAASCRGTPVVRAMLQILKRFGWTWIGLLVSDDDYGLNVARSFQSELAQSGEGCLAYLEVLPWGNNPGELQRIVGIMKKSTSRVVIVFAHENHMLNLLGEVVRQNVTGLQWMASEAWTATTVLQIPSYMPFLAGTLDGSTFVQNVGVVKETAAKGGETTLKEDIIFWNFVPKKPPRSVCSESCPPGTRMARRKNEPDCCFDCIPCSEGEISNMTVFATSVNVPERKSIPPSSK